MEKKLKIKRGLESNRTNLVPESGELIVTTDKKRLYLGDGKTAGGNLIISLFFNEWNITSVISQATYVLDSSAEKFSDPQKGIYMVFYGGAKLNKNDYTINSVENKIVLNFTPEEKDIDINIVYIGL